MNINISTTCQRFLDRRNFLSDNATALGSIALASLLGNDGLLASTTPPAINPARPFAPRLQHFPAKAKNVIVHTPHL